MTASGEPATIGISAPSLALDGFGAAFGQRVILASLDVVLPAQGVDVLMGPVKTGKSTLMRSLAGLNHANALFKNWGSASMSGQPVQDGWRPLLVQQHAAALAGSVREGVVFHCRQAGGKSPANWSDFAVQALQEHGLQHLVAQASVPLMSLPLEWQRAVNILSCALRGPPLLMVDEPTYGLDDMAAQRLVDWLAQLGKSVKLLIALHHQGQARRLADRILLIGGGRVLCHTDTATFFQHPPNDWVLQFVRSGSFAIASPDAAAEDLNPDVEPAPKLSAAALAAIARFGEPPAVAAQSPAPPTAAPVATPVAIAAIPPPVAPVTAPAAVPVSPAMPPVKPAEPDSSHHHHHHHAALPPTSKSGVEEAAMVGRAIMTNYRGPAGFYWVLPGKLAGCAEPGISSPIAYDLELLTSMGINYLVTLTEKDLDQDTLADYKLKNIHLPIFDREAPSISQAYMLVRRMQLLLDKGHVVAVHCKAGIGRTGTILASWLIREGGISAENAISRLRAINPAYVQTAVQEAFLGDFEQNILRRM